MSFIRYHTQPVLRDPVVIVAFGGWNDAAESATSAIKYLIDKWKPEKFAEIDAEDFFDYTEARPMVKLVDGLQRTIVWPSNVFYAHKDDNYTRDVILMQGFEPQLKWKTFVDTFIQLCKRYSVSEVVFLGALLAEVPHSIDVPISGTSSTAEVMERLREMDVRGSRYEGPTGILGVLQDACSQEHIPGVSFWAAVPHYLAATPNTKVTSALLTYVNTFLSFGLDLSGVQSDALHFDEQISQLVARNPEASAYVKRLEEQVDEEDDDDDDDDDEEATNSYLDKPLGTGPLPSADMLIRDVEELLRKERENGMPPLFDDEDEE
jgi:proteasome assembly chaperone (PAC2) family protein